MVERKSFHDVLRNEKVIYQSSTTKKKTKTAKKTTKQIKNGRIFSLAWSIVNCLLKSHCLEFFKGEKYGHFWAKTLMQIWYLLITKKSLFWTFQEWEIRSFLRQTVERLFYWSPKCSCFELFGDRKYGLSWGKKLMERWYLLVTETFLLWAFPW